MGKAYEGGEGKSMTQQERTLVLQSFLEITEKVK